MPLLFSYGTLQEEGVQLSTFGRLLRGQPDELVGFEASMVKIEDPQVVTAIGRTHHANVVFNGRDDSRVGGMVFEITDIELAAADRYEQAASYERVAAKLASGRQAWVYVDAARHQEAYVSEPLESLKAELERFGEANDAATNERSRRMLNITRDTGELLAVLVRATAARRLLEIGTSNGYSTLWLADAAGGTGGSVTTVELAEHKIGLAKANFARSGLSPFITLVHDDAGRFLRRTDESAYDLIFLDSERQEYPGWWPHLRRVLRPGGLLIVDNATSHAEQMVPFVALVRADPEFATCLVPVGNGEFLAVKASS